MISLISRKLTVTSLLLLALLTSTTPALAAELDEAKAKGFIGEQPSGYLGVVAPNAPAAVQNLVARINRERKTHYQEIAKKNNTPLTTVETLAGAKAIEKTAPGQFVFSPSGSWQRK